MAGIMRLDIVSSEGQIFSGDAIFIVVPGELGELGIYPGHAPLLTRLRPGSVRYQIKESFPEVMVYVSGGILEIKSDVVSVLSDTAIRATDLDEDRIKMAMEAAKSHLSQRHDAIDYAQAQIELAEAIAQLSIFEKFKALRTTHYSSEASSFITASSEPK